MPLRGRERRVNKSFKKIKTLFSRHVFQCLLPAMELSLVKKPCRPVKRFRVTDRLETMKLTWSGWKTRLFFIINFFTVCVNIQHELLADPPERDTAIVMIRVFCPSVYHARISPKLSEIVLWLLSNANRKSVQLPQSTNCRLFHQPVDRILRQNFRIFTAACRLSTRALGDWEYCSCYLDMLACYFNILAQTCSERNATHVTR